MYLAAVELEQCMKQQREYDEDLISMKTIRYYSTMKRSLQWIKKKLQEQAIDFTFMNKYVILRDCSIVSNVFFDTEHKAKTYQLEHYIDGFVYFIRGLCMLITWQISFPFILFLYDRSLK